MSPWKAAHAGDHFDTIDTPALVLDLDAFERNMKRLQDAMSKAGVRLRPHAKSHKCPEIALQQIKAGAIGICCQKVSEAAVFVNAGVDDILITNQIVGEQKVVHAHGRGSQHRCTGTRVLLPVGVARHPPPNLSTRKFVTGAKRLVARLL